ncbi:hypothetical protein AGMMS50239_34890 [Bacteroidia bacterium]|nr:hypothetical protein AGMMS50239_34890 [Bacteroidia bacterium]
MIMEFTAIFVMGFLTLGTYKIFELFVKRKERLTIIEKLISLNLESAEPIRLPNILYEKQGFGSWPLRISLLLIGIGLGCLCAFFLQMYYGETINWDQKRMIEFASIALFGGIGLFIAFMIELKQKKIIES